MVDRRHGTLRRAALLALMAPASSWQVGYFMGLRPPASRTCSAQLNIRYDSTPGAWPAEEEDALGRPADGKDGSGRTGQRQEREKGGSYAKNLDLAKVEMLCLEDGSDLGEVHEALHGRRLRPQDYTTLITELRHARKWRLAVSVGDWLVEQPVKAGAEALPNLVHYKDRKSTRLNSSH